MSEEHKHGSGDAGCGGKEQEPYKETRVLNANVAASGQTILRVAGMDCPDEIAAIERALKPLAGVGEVKVNLMAGTATIAHEASVTPEQLIRPSARPD